MRVTSFCRPRNRSLRRSSPPGAAAATRRGRAGTLALGGVILAAFAAAGAGSALGQRQVPELPAEVKAWLEREQFRQWVGLLEEGKKLFEEGSCTRCHGAGGAGGRSGPNLTDAEWVQSEGSLEGIRETIFWGVRRRDFADASRRFEMNPSGGMQLEWDQVRALGAYVWSLSHETGIPQR